MYLVSWSAAYGEQLDNGDILETLRLGAKMNMQQVKDGRGDLVFYGMLAENTGGHIREFSGKCRSMFIGSKVRWDMKGTVTVDGAPATQLIDGINLDTSVIEEKSLFDGEKLLVYEARRNRADFMRPTAGHKDQWQRMLPLYYGKIDIEDILNRGETVSVVGQESIDGYLCYKIEISRVTKAPNGKEVTLKNLSWIDPARGYMVPKVQVWAYLEGKEMLTEDVVTELKEYASNLWRPVRSSQISYRANPPDYEPYKAMEQRVVFENYDFNLDLSDSDLEIKLPEGTEVYDDVLGIRLYVVGKEM
jgi:hypothetical protein